MLPQDFIHRMEQMLFDEASDFFKSYDREKYRALRLNAIKGDTKKMAEEMPFHLSPVCWEKNGYYFDKMDTPGKHPYHEAGVYYIQEPSAMAPVSYLMEDEKKEADETRDYEERILDLCAAPGGKSTQIAAAMEKAYQSGMWSEPGFLLCNEIHPARAKILSENVERMGIANAMVTNETPQHLADTFEEYFTRILVDAPCSGEGMFRKNEDACEEWSLENVKLCAKRQDEILDCAAIMLAPGGRMVYSTCTFAPDENEGSMARFLMRHPEFHVEKVTPAPGMEYGVPEWALLEEGTCRAELANTIRLWPQKLHGEGHYLAVLKKDGTLSAGYQGYCKNGMEKGFTAKELRTPGKGALEFQSFAKETLLSEQLMALAAQEGRLLTFGEQLYLIPKGMPALKGLKVLRPGLHLGTIKKNRLEPAHALALFLKPEEVRFSVNLSADSREVRDYLNGGTFPYEGEKGWYLILVDGYSIGWGKLAGGIMKNHYPKGLRKML